MVVCSHANFRQPTARHAEDLPVQCYVCFYLLSAHRKKKDLFIIRTGANISSCMLGPLQGWLWLVVQNSMPCFYGSSEREKAELRDLLELANAQKEEYRKAAEMASRRAEELSRQLNKQSADMQQLSGKLQTYAQKNSRLSLEVKTLQEQIMDMNMQLDTAMGQQAVLQQRLQDTTTERTMADAQLRKLTKDREYLRTRVDRMQKALSMLDSVLDDTLRESGNAANERVGFERAAMLRQSKEYLQEWLRDPHRSKESLSQLSEHSEVSESGDTLLSPRARDQHHHMMAGY
eukprot:jgi/Chrzof1/5321/Cz15g22020.t1